LIRQKKYPLNSYLQRTRGQKNTLDSLTMTQITDLNQLSSEQLRERHQQLENQLVQMRADIERLNTELLQQRETYLNIQSQILGESVKIYSISPLNSGEM
jgi:hypothetical protein